MSKTKSSNKVLETICLELFERFENESVPKTQIIREYFAQRVKEDEISAHALSPSSYVYLEKLVKEKFLREYGKYAAAKERILEKSEKRQLWKYALGAIAVIEVVELLVTKGRSLSPRSFFPTALLDGIYGGVIYYAVKSWDNVRISQEKKKLFRSVGSIERELTVTDTIQVVKDMTKGRVLNSEAYLLFRQYDDSSRFWEDFGRVREKDPTNHEAFETLNAPAFASFLPEHLNGKHDATTRSNRFKDLEGMARKYFAAIPYLEQQREEINLTG
ncbi:hypothetical protein HY486_04525 [Candidatus Woesearchaeota archaeon]|nr:hypothetical protein [Candidatus Woesearchaeota archaeon]